MESYLFSNYRGSKKGGLNHPLHYKWFVFSNTIIKKEVIDKVGLFNESLTKYGGEDTEMAIRMYQVFPKGMRQKKDIIAYHMTNKTLDQYL